MTTNWILRVGDGKNFKASSKLKIWGIRDIPSNKHFITNVKSGDILWFVLGKSKGKLMCVATYNSQNRRELGPLLSVTPTDIELGWGEIGSMYQIEIHYSHLYELVKIDGLLTHIKSPMVIRLYNEKCKVNLPLEYNNIMRDCTVIDCL